MAREFIVSLSMGECTDRLRRAHEPPTFEPERGLRTDIVVARLDGDTTRFEISRLPNRERPALEYDYDLSDIKETIVIAQTGFLYRLTDYSTMVSLERPQLPNLGGVFGRAIMGWIAIVLVVALIMRVLVIPAVVVGLPLTLLLVMARLAWRWYTLQRAVNQIF